MNSIPGNRRAGQAQRIALARAYLKDAPLLILDEATANLDPRTAHEINASLMELVSGRTALMIAHTLSMVRNADQIIVLSEGDIVEIGDHDSLITLDGLYKRMLFAEEPAASARE